MEPEYLLSFLQGMKHSPIRNYAGIPGLTSWMIGAPSPNGHVRLMECTRTHHENIIPHSHRFNFRCLVLAGSVRNILWFKDNQNGEPYRSTEMLYTGMPGQYTFGDTEVRLWNTSEKSYHYGEQYMMAAHEVHSIFFERDTSVLFFEGPSTSDRSIILEPIADGVYVPTFTVEPWAFSRG